MKNPFAVTKSDSQTNAIASSEAERAIQEVQAALVIAKRFPRDQVDAMDRILNACTRHTLAEGALYSYVRGGTEITGPSIRLAESIAQHWGNMQFGLRELSQEHGTSTMQAYAWDLETNTRKNQEFQVKHERHTRSGAKTLTDPRDIYEMTANMGARRMRACILAVVPGDVVEAAQKQCETTLYAKADTSEAAVKKMLAAFEQFGVNKAQIEKRIGRRLDTITPAQMVQIKKVYTSLRDGMSKPGDWFEITETEATSGAAEALKAKQAKKKSSVKPDLPPIPDELTDIFTAIADEIKAGRTDEAREVLDGLDADKQSILRPHVERAMESQ